MRVRIRSIPAVSACVLLAALPGCSNESATPTDPTAPTQLFDQDTLHTVDLTLSAGDWDALRANFQANTYYDAEVTIDGETVRNMAIRSRGA